MSSHVTHGPSQKSFQAYLDRVEGSGLLACEDYDTARAMDAADEAASRKRKAKEQCLLPCHSCLCMQAVDPSILGQSNCKYCHEQYDARSKRAWVLFLDAIKSGNRTDDSMWKTEWQKKESMKHNEKMREEERARTAYTAQRSQASDDLRDKRIAELHAQHLVLEEEEEKRLTPEERMQKKAIAPGFLTKNGKFVHEVDSS